MATTLPVLFVFVCFSLSSLQIGLADKYNVLRYGAVGDGKEDDTKAFVEAWDDFCKDDGTPILVVPSGKTFLVGPIHFQGPCNAPNLRVELAGTIVAPINSDSWKGCLDNSWLYFDGVDGLLVTGGGTIDGRGEAWWNNQVEGQDGCDRPMALRFNNCKFLQVRGLKHRDSPGKQVRITMSQDVTVANLDILAPEESPNTDGINIADSTRVQVMDSLIRTGDDCVAIIGHKTSQINVTGIRCGPGHGISIGSLGRDGDFDTVEDVHVRNCNFTGTQNGARIKTWQGGSGYAKRITFEQINLDNVHNPIIIDQYYCDKEKNCPTKSLAVKVSDITYRFVQGTSPDIEAISFNCSETVPCTNLILEQVQINHATSEQRTSADCINAHGKSIDTVPTVSCLATS